MNRSSEDQFRFSIWYMLALNVLSFLVCFVLGTVSFLSKDKIEFMLQRGYFVMLVLLFSSLIGVIVNYFYKQEVSISAFLRNNRQPIFVGLGIAGIVFLATKPELRVFNDEINYLSTSFSMYFLQKVSIVNEGYFWQGVFSPVATANTIRPAFFPFLIFLLHSIIGYRIENVFILNYLSLSLLIAIIFKVFKKKGSALLAITAVLLCVAQPVINVFAASGSFDFFNAVYLIVCFYLVRNFLVKESRESFQLLWINLILLGHVRPESAVYLLLIMGVLCIRGHLKQDYFRPLFFYLLTIASFFPLVWQKILAKGIYPNVYDYKPDDLPAFGLINLINNTEEFLKQLVQYDLSHLQASLINVLGIIAAVILTSKFLKKKIHLTPSLKTLGICIVLAVGFHWFLFNFYWYGGVHKRLTGRFYVLPFIFLSILPVVCAAKLKWSFWARGALLSFSVGLFLYYRPAIKQEVTFNNGSHRKNNTIINSFLKNRNDTNMLLVSKVPKQFLIKGISSIGFRRFNREVEKNLERLETGRFSDIIVAQTVSIETGKPLRGNKKSNKLEYELVYKDLKRGRETMEFWRVVSPSSRKNL